MTDGVTDGLGNKWHRSTSDHGSEGKFSGPQGEGTLSIDTNSHTI